MFTVNILNFNHLKQFVEKLFFKMCISCHFAGAEQVDIGLPYFRACRTKEVKQRKQVLKDNKSNVELERALRLRTCKLSHDQHSNRCCEGCGEVVHFPIFPSAANS